VLGWHGRSLDQDGDDEDAAGQGGGDLAAQQITRIVEAPPPIRSSDIKPVPPL
jgi:hypothetical protein